MPFHRFRHQCRCHEQMGNDFWFLPTGQCLRADRTCTKKIDDRKVFWSAAYAVLLGLVVSFLFLGVYLFAAVRQ